MASPVVSDTTMVAESESPVLELSCYDRLEETNANTHHPDYYLDDGNLVILVENALFKIHRSTLIRHSNVFRNILSLPLPLICKSREGCSDNNPLNLSGILAVDFERLLWILYPETIGLYRATTFSEWRSILDLSIRWEFNDIRRLSIAAIGRMSLPAIDRVALSLEYDIRAPWVHQAYIELCERPEPLSVVEARLLGLEVSIRIAQLREKIREKGAQPQPLAQDNGKALVLKDEQVSSGPTLPTPGRATHPPAPSRKKKRKPVPPGAGASFPAPGALVAQRCS